MTGGATTIIDLESCREPPRGGGGRGGGRPPPPRRHDFQRRRQRRDRLRGSSSSAPREAGRARGTRGCCCSRLSLVGRVLACYLAAALFQRSLPYLEPARGDAGASGVELHAHQHDENGDAERSRRPASEDQSLRGADELPSQSKAIPMPPPPNATKARKKSGAGAGGASPLVPLGELTRSRGGSAEPCPPGLVRVGNVAAAPAPRRPSAAAAAGGEEEEGWWRGKVPRVVHQTAKSRCVTPVVAEAIGRWQSLEGWSYYFHDDRAVRRLFRQERRRLRWQQQRGDEVPGAARGGDEGGLLLPLLDRAVRACAAHSGTIRADLFRYLVLYRYGGVYADIDSVPSPKFTPPDPYLLGAPQGSGENATTTSSSGISGSSAPLNPPDALFFVEQYHLLSQYFMASSPGHPILWYAIQHGALRLLGADDTGRVSAAVATGPHALHRALASFAADGIAPQRIDPALPGNRPVRAGTYVGTGNWSVTVLGRAEDHREYVDRDVLRGAKRAEYARMAMRHFQDDKKRPSGRSCLSSLLELSRAPRTSDDDDDEEEGNASAAILQARRA